MSPDALRAAIAADCPHRLVDYDRHLAGFDTRGWIVGPAFIQLWQIEHAISSQPVMEAQLAELDRQAQASSDPTAAKDCLEQASRIRHKIRQGLK